MGVPGCIDYALLTLVKQGKVAPRVEKDLNQSLNVWLRCPCAVIAGYLQLVDPSVCWSEVSTASPPARLVAARY
jgi:hypothetical protein